MYSALGMLINRIRDIEFGYWRKRSFPTSDQYRLRGKAKGSRPLWWLCTTNTHGHSSILCLTLTPICSEADCDPFQAACYHPCLACEGKSPVRMESISMIYGIRITSQRWEMMSLCRRNVAFLILNKLERARLISRNQLILYIYRLELNIINLVCLKKLKSRSCLAYSIILFH